MEPLQFILAITGIIVSGLCGGLAGAIVSHFFTILREASGRRFVFRNIIAVFLAELQDTDDDGADFYKSSRHNIIVECAKIRSDIVCCKQAGFEAARVAFCDLKKSECDRLAQNITHKLFASEGAKRPPGDDRTTKKKVIQILQEMTNCAK